MTQNATQRRGLIEKDFVKFYPELAIRAGTANKALILQKFAYIIKGKEDHDVVDCLHDGQFWFYGTYEHLVEKHFPWIKVPSLKRIIRELEIIGVVISREYEGDQRTKWYTLAGPDEWNAWFDERTLADDQRAIKAAKSGSKRSAKPDHNDPQIRIKMIRKIGSKESAFRVPLLYIDSKNLTKNEKAKEKGLSTSSGVEHFESEESPPVNGPVDDVRAGEQSTDPTAPPDVDDDEIKKFIMPEIQKLQFPPDLQVELLSRGCDYALAVAWAAQKGDNPGGLARHLMDNGGPPGELLEWAQKAIQLHTLDPALIDSAENLDDVGGDDAWMNEHELTPEQREHFKQLRQWSGSLHARHQFESEASVS